jgi:hypothetical protein
MGGWGGGGIEELVRLTTGFSTAFHHIFFGLGTASEDQNAQAILC